MLSLMQVPGALFFSPIWNDTFSKNGFLKLIIFSRYNLFHYTYFQKDEKYGAF